MPFHLLHLVLNRNRLLLLSLKEESNRKSLRIMIQLVIQIATMATVFNNIRTVAEVVVELDRRDFSRPVNLCPEWRICPFTERFRAVTVKEPSNSNAISSGKEKQGGSTHIPPPPRQNINKKVFCSKKFNCFWLFSLM